MDVPCAEALLAAWVGAAVRRRPVDALATLDVRAVRRVLLVLTTGLGDTVLSTPIFEAVRRSMPQARLGLFVRQPWAPLFSAEPDVDEVIVYPGKWRRFFSTLAGLRRFAPELTLILHGNDPDIIPLVYLAGSRHIVRIPTAGTRYRRLLSNASRPEDAAPLPGLHYVDNRLRILDTLGIPATRSTPVVRCDLAARRKAADSIEAAIGRGKYIVVHPWAADAYKTWPLSQARAFIEAALARWTDIGMVITGSDRDRAVARALADGLPTSRVVVTAGDFDLAGMSGLLAGAAVTVAPDTGILHLAAALDVPTVGLYSPTQASLVGPRAASAPVQSLQRPLTCTPCLEKRCPYPAALCMQQFAASDVLASVAACLEADE